MHTSILRKLPTIDLILHNISPIEGALAEMEVQGYGVSQAWYQDTELAFIQINAADLVTVRENDEGFERICRTTESNDCFSERNNKIVKS